MNKITAEHLSRRACVYVRQSTPDQVQNNLESQRRQYALVERARQLGWQQVEVIDDDLGRSGSGTARPGFDRLLRMLCDGEVGAVLSIRDREVRGRPTSSDSPVPLSSALPRLPRTMLSCRSRTRQSRRWACR